MEKRLKYILSFLIVWIWLLFNQSFAWNTYLYVEWVTLPLLSSNFSSSSAYLYTFNNQTGRIESVSQSYPNLWYSLTYNWNTDYTYRPCFRSNLSCSSYTFNNSVYWSYLYQSRTWKTVNGSFYYSRNQTRPWYNPIKIVLWDWDDFWKNFIYTNAILNDTGVFTPHFMLWWWFFTSLDYTFKTAPNINNYLRLFFNQNVNLTSPLDWLNLAEWTWSNISWSVAWQYFTPNSAVYRTKYQTSDKYIIDYGREWTKGIHFWWYWMWYTFSVQMSTNPDELYWWNWSFWSIWSRCIESAMKLWLTDFDTLTNSACSSLWLLVLKWDSYVSSSNNASVVILWKNPNNTKQILYEQFDCAEDDLLRIMNNWTWDDEFCNSISHWYITYNWSSDILPFNDKMSTYNVWWWNKFLDFMFSWWFYWYVSMEWNKYCLNKVFLSTNRTWQYCFSLTATPNLKSLKEMYLDNWWDLAWNWWTVGGAWLDDVIINNPSWYYTYSWLVEYAMSWDFYVSEDENYIENYVDYTFINWVPQLKNLKFWVCPFTTNSNFATLWVEDFSFDMLVPHKCILAWLQAWYTSVNMSWYVNMNFSWKFINDNLNNENAGLIWHFVAILLIFGVSWFVFYFLKLFK